MCFIQFSMSHRKKGANFMPKNKVFGQSGGAAVCNIMPKDSKLDIATARTLDFL